MRVERVDFVSIPARDRERARRFYGDVLGRRAAARRRTSSRRPPRDFEGNVLILHRRYAPVG